MSGLRPELRDSNKPSVPDTTALYLIKEAVKTRTGLIHGHLHVGNRSCAIGAFFADNRGVALNSGLIDEVAAFNDSMPHATQKERRGRVLRWLRERIRIREH